jgi:CheY-like chemotaxis protein
MAILNTNSNNKRALVIEDEPVIARVCRKTLVAEGFNVDIAVNGLIACDMADKNTYDLYVSDIRTPEMNGMEFFHHLRKANPKLKNRVIFTTGDILSAEVKEFLQEFGVAFLPKPFTPDQLIETVSLIIQ